MMSGKEVRKEGTEKGDVMVRLDALLERKAAPQPSDLPPPAERARLRKAYGLSQAEVAEALGVKRASVSAWEQGRWEPRGETRGEYVYLLREINKRLKQADQEGTTDDQH